MNIKKHIPEDLRPKYKLRRYVKCALCCSHVAPSFASNQEFGPKTITACHTCTGMDSQ
jgi:hypothetical protein